MVDGGDPGMFETYAMPIALLVLLVLVGYIWLGGPVPWR